MNERGGEREIASISFNNQFLVNNFLCGYIRVDRTIKVCFFFYHFILLSCVSRQEESRQRQAYASLFIATVKKKQRNENRIDKKEEGAFNTPDDDRLDNRKKMVSR
jgi:hypothetical protein